jgi:phage shock protein A
MHLGTYEFMFVDQLAEATAELGTAMKKLSQNEQSWREQREVLQGDIDRANQRVRDLEQQNDMLHSHLQQLTTQHKTAIGSSQPDADAVEVRYSGVVKLHI